MMLPSRHTRLSALLLTLALPLLLAAQGGGTVVKGVVIDARTAEKMPFVQVYFVGTQIGTVTDIDGRFTLKGEGRHDSVQFRMMGYESGTIRVAAGGTTSKLKVALRPKAITLDAVTISASSKESRYRRRNNPAVDLVRKVIARKDSNNIEFQPHYTRHAYQKTTLALDDFHPDFATHRFWKHFPFIEKYIDVTPFDGTEILHVSIREQLSDESYRRSPYRRQQLVIAKRMEGIDQNGDNTATDNSLADMFTPVDIFSGDIELMLNHFVSPLSAALAVSYYHYYITDTVDVGPSRCVELSFFPANAESYGFTGRMYIAIDDGSYALTKYVLQVQPQVNLNFVRDLTVIQTFERDSAGRYLPLRTDTYGRLYLTKRMRQIYAHQTRHYSGYDFDADPSLQPDSLFSPLVHTATLPRKRMLRKEWNARRPVELTMQETMLDSLRYELRRIPSVNAALNTLEVLFTGYIPTGGGRDSSRFDIGSVYSFLSRNGVEGWRMRLGGTTTALLSRRDFAEGYVAYGFGDRRIKGGLTLTHTFNDKRRYPRESPKSFVALSAQHDVEMPGLPVTGFARDNLIMSSSQVSPALYLSQVKLQAHHAWPFNLSVDGYVAAQHFEPTATLDYMRTKADGGLERVEAYNAMECVGTLKFSPRPMADDGHGASPVLSLNKDAPEIELTHTLGSIDGFIYNRTSITASKRLWFSIFGHLDLHLQSGIVWNRVPLPKLFVPHGNANIFLSDVAFNTMRPMEFVVDQYAALFATYHFKGLLLRQIPLVKKLHLREVASFNILYGGLTPKNNPTTGTPGLYQFPTDIRTLGTEPYMEYSVGIENIFRFVRVDYVRRLSYLDGVARRDGIRISLKFTL